MPAKLQLLSLTLSSLLISSAYAERCGKMIYTQCTDDACSTGCTTVEYEPSDCSASYLQITAPYGAVAAMCDQQNQKMRFQFYVADDCIGDRYRNNKEYDFGVCQTNDLGSAKLEPSGDQPLRYELTQAEYEERFNQRWTTNADFNVLGYGQRNMYVPPLNEPTWLLTELDRYGLTSITMPWTPFLTSAFISALGDPTFSFFWYNNGQAAGQQLYPDGMSKYYDMFSLTGITKFLIYWVWYRACDLSRPFLLLPMNVWLGIFNGMKFDEIWKIFIPTIITWFFHIRGERGWILG